MLNMAKGHHPVAIMTVTSALMRIANRDIEHMRSCQALDGIVAGHWMICKFGSGAAGL